MLSRPLASGDWYLRESRDLRALGCGLRDLATTAEPAVGDRTWGEEQHTGGLIERFMQAAAAKVSGEGAISLCWVGRCCCCRRSCRAQLLPGELMEGAAVAMPVVPRSLVGVVPVAGGVVSRAAAGRGTAVAWGIDTERSILRLDGAG